jgi:hydrogenase maturation protein HypF
LEHSLHHQIIALTVHINGLVQGVGFRPFIYRLAKEHHLNGWVVNRTDGVTIKVEGLSGRMARFIEDIRYKAPVAAQIEEIRVDQDMPEGLEGFFILASQDMSDETSEICPDIAVCPECLADMKTQPHRKNYSFTNCTNCGPRFSIIKDFPYDRSNTTMAPFAMCENCSEEYSSIADRRFHAQPVACNNCGPQYSMHTGSEILTTTDAIINRIIKLIESGGVIALKGMGGFHLMCNALDEKAVDRLREIKKREGKPFAVMFRDVEAVREFAEVSAIEAEALLSWKRPVVLLNAIYPLSAGITLQLNTLGAFLPYMPIHHLIFEKLAISCLVLTSGNIADEPIIISNETALETFTDLTDGIVIYNRDIYNRTDDSVVRIANEKPLLIRRSRGFAPAPVRLSFDVDGVLAVGAELSNSFCIGKGNRAYMSQHIGDLKNHETFLFFEEAQSRFKQMFRITLNTVAADLHPDYLSTRFAVNSGLNLIQVQHHHAHIASCMVENGIDEQVIGVAFDGTGYGSDGNIWGSEFMVCDLYDFERHASFEYMAMPGGDKASHEPWRMGLSLLHQAFGDDIFQLDLPFIKGLKPDIVKQIVESVRKGINCPLTCGAGRLFDAIAAITGICVHSHYHSEAPMRLESVIQAGITDYYDFTMNESISFLPAVRSICEDIRSGISPGIISAKFHNTIVEATLKMVEKISHECGLQIVALSGGSFQNKYLLESLETGLTAGNYTVLTHSKVPCNDGGIALGQIAVAARRRGRI